ncbi:MAG: hypothetical protein DMD41_15030, partial [Gemmatimonadetes bacterium]
MHFSRLLLPATLALATPLSTQTASPYVPLQYWGMPYAEHLIAAGVMADPSPLTRPFDQAALVRSLSAVDTTALRPAERRIVRELVADLARREQGPWGRVDGHVGVAAASHPLRDPLEIDRGVPVRSPGKARGFVSGGLGFTALLGPVALVTHPYFDTRLKYDPDFVGKKDKIIAGRNAEAYLRAAWRYGEVFFGNVDRNWGPSAIQGALLSDEPYNLDHLGLVVGTAGFQLQAIVTQLNSLPDSTGAIVNRYMVQH